MPSEEWRSVVGDNIGDEPSETDLHVMVKSPVEN